MDGLAFMASSIVGSRGVGNLVQASGLSSKLAAKSAAKIAAGESVGMYNQLNLLAANSGLERGLMTTYSTLSESATEAYGVQKEIKEELNQKRELGRQGIAEYKAFADMTDEQIKSKAANAAANTFGANMMILPFSG
jgi:VIT1/CCC1 family predicted Fe2+/Mn2+ transporter